MTSVRLDHLRKTFPDGTTGLHDFSLEIADGEFLTFLGPSGCGKTTTLRMIAGLESPSSGTITFGSRRVDQLTPAARNVAMVFQSYALYPHMTVRQNLAYPLRKRGVPRTQAETRIAEVAALLKMGQLLDRRPRQLSGGQQQRVALGRAMVRDCDVFLLDEPLSNLDAELRAHMRTELIQLHQRIRRTTVYVTHDQVEAMTMSTRIAVMHGGTLQQVGTPDEIYHDPVNRFVASFVGAPKMNFVEGTLVAGEGGVRFLSDHLSIALSAAQQRSLAQAVGTRAIAGLRPESLILSRQPGPAVVSVVEKSGYEALISLTLGGQVLVTRNHDGQPPAPGASVSLLVQPGKALIFSAESGERLDRRSSPN